MTHEVLSDKAAFKTVGYFMTTKLTVPLQEGIEQDLTSPDKRPRILKVPHNPSEPLWKRNLAKTVKTKKIGEISRAKGGRH